MKKMKLALARIMIANECYKRKGGFVAKILNSVKNLFLQSRRTRKLRLVTGHKALETLSFWSEYKVLFGTFSFKKKYHSSPKPHQRSPVIGKSGAAFSAARTRGRACPGPS